MKTGCLTGIVGGTVLSGLYVGSLYVWRGSWNRNDPRIIRRRFFSVLVIMTLAPVYLWVICSPANLLELWTYMGLRGDHIAEALVLPLLLLVLFYLGPLVVCFRYHTKDYLLNECAHNGWIFARNYIVSPFSEEFVYRACLVPLLKDCFTMNQLIFVTPLFFGISHLHHMYELVQEGVPVLRASIVTLFQMGYTCIFGAYCTFLFLRTGHLASCFVSHAFCNLMGLPDVSLVLHQEGRMRVGILSAFLCGFGLFFYLLGPLTDPAHYGNNFY
ncbi:unnamed protein product [Darwinula stevensoni]|uniref:CAAX prenyl protease 2 n=1 Tax=Darwinula stevensoni TaxID=69355 RepID=A0A7R9A9I7_9CRUS|nr:unnamed protein product [Darwinula stevensoni]CAG0897442.1 unnamed protein product [Darwinula stevensoni]